MIIALVLTEKPLIHFLQMLETSWNKTSKIQILKMFNRFIFFETSKTISLHKIEIGLEISAVESYEEVIWKQWQWI